MGHADLQKRKFREVLQALGQQTEFAKQDVVLQCQESKPQFVARVIKQLVAEGVLLETDAGPQHYRWVTAPASFRSSAWIENQIAGSQVTQAPAEERPRERLVQLGAANLKTSELFAILIRSGRKGESAVQAGQKLSNRFSDHLERLPTLSPQELKEASSVVSEVAYCQIQAGIELGRRVSEAAQRMSPKPRINSTHAAKDYCLRHFARLAQDACQEEFHIVSLDTKLQPIQSHRITIGTLDASLVHPREVFRPAIRDMAASVLLVHNHPSGDPAPSQEDKDVTKRLKSAGDILGIGVIDHIIVAKEQVASLAEYE